MHKTQGNHYIAKQTYNTRMSFSSGWATGTCPLLVVWRLVRQRQAHEAIGWSSGTGKDLSGGRVLGEILGGPVERVAMGDIRAQAQEEPHGAHLAGTRGHRQRSVFVLFPSRVHTHISLLCTPASSPQFDDAKPGRVR